MKSSAPKKKKSITSLINRNFILIIVSFLLISLFLFFSLFSMLHRYVYNNIKEALEGYIDSMSKNLEDNMAILISNCSRSRDITNILIDEDDRTHYEYQTHIHTMLSNNLNPVSKIGGYFVYFPDPDIFIPATNTFSYASNNEKGKAIIKTWLRDQDNEVLEDISKKGSWFILADSSETDSYFVRILQTQHVFIGTFMNIRELTSIPYFSQMQSSIFITDDVGHVIGDPTFAAYTFPPENSDDHSYIYHLDGLGRFISVSGKTTLNNYYINVLIKDNEVWALLPPMYLIVLLFVLECSFLFVFIQMLLRQLAILPDTLFRPVTEQIRSGETSLQIDLPTRYREIENIAESFNLLVHEMQQLKIDNYESRISIKEMELKMLKRQLAPHFLLNCLNTVYAAAQDTEHDDIAQEIMRTYSEYIRYSLSERRDIPLETELYHVENYILLSKYRFPGCLEYHADIDPVLYGARAFPFILLTLTENSIKHGLIMGEVLDLSIKGIYYDSDEGRRIHITHWDSGNGLSPKLLELYNHLLEHGDITVDGHHIGIYNLVKQIDLYFGDGGKILFSNKPGAGLCVEMDFPYYPMQEAIPDRFGE